MGDLLEPVGVHQRFDLALFPLVLASLQPVVHADPNQRGPQPGQDEGRQHAQRRFDAEGTQGGDIAEQVGRKGRHGRQRRERDGSPDTGHGDAAGFFGGLAVGALFLVAMQRVQ